MVEQQFIMKINGIPDDEYLKPHEIASMLGALGPKFKVGQKVWLKCGTDDAGMVQAIVAYVNHFGYRVRLPDGTLDEFEDYELNDSRKWD